MVLLLQHCFLGVLDGEGDGAVGPDGSCSLSLRLTFDSRTECSNFAIFQARVPQMAVNALRIGRLE